MSSDYPEFSALMEIRRQVNGSYSQTSNPSYDRTRAEILDLVTSSGFTARADDLIDVAHDADGRTETTPLSVYSLIAHVVE